MLLCSLNPVFVFEVVIRARTVKKADQGDLVTCRFPIFCKYVISSFIKIMRK